MSAEFEDCDLRHVFQNGKWVLRRVSGSQASKHATVSKRMFYYQNLPKYEENKYTDMSGRFTSAKPEVTETSKIMKRDFLTRACPWISTTYKDFYGQRYPKLTDRRRELKLSMKKPENDADRLLSSVTHVPVIRMNCYDEEHFVSHYSRKFQDPGLSFKQPEPEQKDFDFTKSTASVVPESPRMWMTTYGSDYVQLSKPKSSRCISPVITEDTDALKEYPFQNDWTTSHQDYGGTGQRIHITTIPYRVLHGIDSTKPTHTQPTSEVGRLIQTLMT